MSSHDNRYAGALIFIFLILGALNASRHEMWRDEIQAWLLAKDSSSPVQLLKNLKYEGHPGVWHLSLFPLSRITPSPIAMQPFHLIIACLSVYLFLRFSPFTKVQKALFTWVHYAILTASQLPPYVVWCKGEDFTSSHMWRETKWELQRLSPWRSLGKGAHVPKHGKSFTSDSTAGWMRWRSKCPKNPPWSR